MSHPLAGATRIKRSPRMRYCSSSRTPRSDTDITAEVNHVNAENDTVGTIRSLDDTPAAQSYNRGTPCRFQVFGAISCSARFRPASVESVDPMGRQVVRR